MKQLVQPNMNVNGVIGYCLSFQDDVYDTGHPFTTPGKNTAQYAWNQAQFKHEDANFPSDVAVPVWWSYLSAGHVMTRLPDGRYYGSPWKQGTTQAILGSRAEVERIYSSGGKYPLTLLGWSEDISGKRVVGEDDMGLTKEQIMVIFELAFEVDDKDVPQDIINAYVGKDLDGLLNHLHQDKTWNDRRKQLEQPQTAQVNRDAVLKYTQENLK